jgi:hypothetical protein
MALFHTCLPSSTSSSKFRITYQNQKHEEYHPQQYCFQMYMNPCYCLKGMTTKNIYETMTSSIINLLRLFITLLYDYILDHSCKPQKPRRRCCSWRRVNKCESAWRWVAMRVNPGNYKWRFGCWWVWASVLASEYHIHPQKRPTE